MSSESEVYRLRNELVRLRVQISRESSHIASKRKSASDARVQAARAKSGYAMQSKVRESERFEAAALAAERKRADLEAKVADREKRLAFSLGRRETEQAASQRRALEALKSQARAAAGQFNSIPTYAHRSRTGSGEVLLGDYDVFLSHASEDKDEVARPLANALASHGLSVWFDELNISVGQSIRREIERGIHEAAFGLVIVSGHFMVKQWTQIELDALWGKKLSANDDLLLPVWHKVTYDEVQAGLPLLAGLHALNTSTMSIGEIAELLARTIKLKNPNPPLL